MYKKKEINYSLYCKEKDMYCNDTGHPCFQKHPFLFSKKTTVYKSALRLLRRGIVTEIREFNLTIEETMKEYTDDDIIITKIRMIEKDIEKKYHRKSNRKSNIATSIQLDVANVFDLISHKYMVFLLYSSCVDMEIVKDYVGKSFTKTNLQEVEFHYLERNIEQVYYFSSDDLNKITILKLLKDENCAFEIYDLQALKFL